MSLLASSVLMVIPADADLEVVIEKQLRPHISLGYGPDRYLREYLRYSEEGGECGTGEGFRGALGGAKLRWLQKGTLWMRLDTNGAVLDWTFLKGEGLSCRSG